MQDAAAVRAAFTEPQEFWSSPLYRRLSAVVARDSFLIELARSARSGQVPTFAFFGAVHALLLGGVVHPLAEFYPSLRADRARPPDRAGPALVAFAHEHADPIRALLQTRLVQTNHVQRAVGLRLGLAAVAEQLGATPAHLVEIGSSAGLVLRHAHYGFRLGNRRFGQVSSPLQLVTQWRSSTDPPDLDAIPALASTTGIDLNPLDVQNPADRAWLEALVWPEDRAKAALLRAALALAVEHPVTTRSGDAVDLCAQWSGEIPTGAARIVFHCATRMHVPADRVAAFDRAIDDLDLDGPTFRLAIEGNGLIVTGPGGEAIRAYDVEGHLGWASPAAGPSLI